MIIKYIIVQLSFNHDKNRKSSLSSLDFKNKRTSSLETYFNSQNFYDLVAKNKINTKNINKENHAQSSKSNLNINLKANVSK